MNFERFDQIKSSPIAWLPGLIPAAGFVIVYGEPGVGKTTFCLRWLAEMTHAKLPRNIYVMSAEDSSSAIHQALGVFDPDPARTFIMGSETATELPSHGGLDLDDASGISGLLADGGIVVIDSLGGFSDLKAAEMKRILTGLRAAASARGLILLIHHSRLGSKGPFISRLVGPSEIARAPRHFLYVGRHPTEEKQRFAVVAKSNLMGGMSGMHCVFQCSDPKEKMFTGTSLSKDELDLLGGSSLESPTRAVKWLQQALAKFGSQPCPVKLLYAMAKEEEQISASSLYRASKFLKIKVQREGFSGACTWELPTGSGNGRG
jgi:hypothetical protein